MANYDLGTARGVIEIEYKGDGAKRAREDLKGTGTSASQADANMGKASRGMAIAGAVIAGGFAIAVKSAMGFEQRLSAISAVSGATSGEMEKIRAKALQLGKDTAFSAGESAQAMEELIKAGLSVDDVLNGAADATVSLAAAGSIAMPEAATISANAMNQFGLTAKDMVGVVDQIAGAANASAIDVSEFGQSLTQVGAVANLAGVSFEDTATAIALMGNAGIKGSDAGTSLKSMFQRLQPTTKAQADLFKELGLITEDGSNKFYDAQGNLKSLADVSGILQGSLKGMTAQQKQATLQTLFGSDAIRAAAVLSKEGSAGFDKMAESMGKVSAADVAKKRMDNFAGTLEQFKGSLETVGITIGTILLPALTSMVGSITGVLNAFLELPGPVQKTIIALVGMVGALLLAGAALIKFVAFAKELRAIYATFRMLAIASAGLTTWMSLLHTVFLLVAAGVKALAVALFTTPIGWIILGIIALVAAIYLLWKHNEAFRDIVIAVWNAIKAAVSAVVAWFTGPFVNGMKAAWAAVLSALQVMGTFFSAVWNGIKAVVSVVFSAIATVISTYINIWRTIISTALAVIGVIWNAFWRKFGGLIKAVWGLIVAVIRLFLAIIVAVIRTQWAVIKAVTSAVWNGIKAVISRVWGAIKAVATAGANLVKAVVTRAWNGLKAITSAVWNAIMAVIRAVWGRIGGTVTSAVNRVRSAISAAWNAVRSLTSSIWNNVVRIISNAVGNLMGHVRSIAGRVRGALSGAGSWLYNAGRNIIQGLINGITAMIGKVTSAISRVTSTISRFVPHSPVQEGPLKVLNRGHAGKQIVRMLIDGMDTMAVPLEQNMNHLLDVSDMVSQLSQVGSVVPTLSYPKAPAGPPVPFSEGSQPAPAVPGPHIELTVYNPVGETTSESLSKQSTRLAELGVF